MERKRLQSSSCGEEEDKEKEEGISPRKRKCVTHRLIFDDDEDEDKHNQMTHENTLWPVTCGNKSGVLDVEKLGRSEPCIECEGCWYSPHEFEKLAGKGACKKWKATIFYKGKPLQFWVEKGSLTTKGYRKRRTKTTKKSESSDSESQELSEEDSEEYHVDEDEDEDEDEDDEDEAVPAVASDRTGNSVIKERTASAISAPGKCAFKMKEVKCIVNRLPETVFTRYRSNSRSEVTGNTRDVATNTVITAEMPPAEESEGDNVEDDDQLPSGEELAVKTEQREGKRVGAENEREALNSGDARSEDKKDEGEIDDGLKNREDGHLTHCEIEKEQNGEDPLYMPRCEIPGNTRDVETNSVINQQNVGDKPEERLSEEVAMETEHRNGQREAAENEREVVNSGSEVTGNTRGVTSETVTKEQDESSFEHLAVQDGCGHADSCHNAAELQVVGQDMSSSQTTQTSDGINSSHVTEAPSQWPSANSDLDTVALDQLKREKIKLQLRVLKIQEHYYTLKMREFKKQ